MKNDLISRQDAIDALDKRFDSIPMEQTTEILLLRKDLRALPSAQPEKRTEERTETHSCDLIERQQAIDALFEILDRPKHAEFLYADEIARALNQLPPSPSRPHGKWIGGGDYPRVCSVCGEEWDQYVSGTIWYDGVPDFCPSCGADMRQDGGAV